MASWFESPSKKQLIIIFTIWLFGITLSTLAITDLFSQNFFQKGSFMMYFMMIGATLSLIKVWINYKKTAI
jgi:hypothetical protein